MPLIVSMLQYHKTSIKFTAVAFCMRCKIYEQQINKQFYRLMNNLVKDLLLLFKIKSHREDLLNIYSYIKISENKSNYHTHSNYIENKEKYYMII